MPVFPETRQQCTVRMNTRIAQYGTGTDSTIRNMRLDRSIPKNRLQVKLSGISLTYKNKQPHRILPTHTPIRTPIRVSAPHATIPVRTTPGTEYNEETSMKHYVHLSRISRNTGCPATHLIECSQRFIVWKLCQVAYFQKYGMLGHTYLHKAPPGMSRMPVVASMPYFQKYMPMLRYSIVARHIM